MQKRITFCFILLFALHSIVDSQTNFNINLNGDDAFIRILDHQKLRLSSGSYTIELKLNLRTFNSWYSSSLIAKRSINSSNGYIATITGESHYEKYKAYIQAAEGNAPNLIGNEIIPLNQWLHICFVFKNNQNEISIYHDGILDNTRDGFYSFSDQCLSDLIIGRDTEFANYFVDGMIDEVRIWDVARPISEVRKLMNRPLGAEYYTSADSGLIAYYRFDKLENLEVGNDNLADDVKDYSINGFHGDLNGGAELGVSTGWNCGFVVKDNADNIRELFIGQGENATRGIDDYYGEIPMPDPATGVFDARLIVPDLSPVGSHVDFRPVMAAADEWVVKFQPANNEFPVRFSWDYSTLPEGNFTISNTHNGGNINIDMISQSSFVVNEGDEFKIFRTLTASSGISYNSNWNILSVPLKTENMQAMNIFNSASSNVFGFNNGYSVAAELENGKGYWVKFEGQGSIPLTGEVTNQPISVNQGWNLIAPFNESVNKSQIVTNPVNILRDLIYGYNFGYQTVNVLSPGKGYWVFAEEPGQIFYSGVKAKIESNEPVEQDNFIMLTDAAGKSNTLYFSEDSQLCEKMLLPPVPPADIFDIRFSGDKLYSDINIDGEFIKLQGVKFPLNISNTGYTLELEFNGNTRILKDGESLSISDNSTIIEIHKIFKATDYKLYDNYPNPFNPETTIEFYLPEVNTATIEFYNSLGQKIKTLINEQYEPGIHKVTFNAAKLASGVYFYRFTSGKFVKVNKMLLIK